jgi:hypothetical protein
MKTDYKPNLFTITKHLSGTYKAKIHKSISDIFKQTPNPLSTVGVTC